MRTPATPLHVISLVTVLAASPMPAQVPSGYWTGWVLFPPASCGVCAYARDGSLLNGFPFNPFSLPVTVRHMSGVVMVADPASSTVTPFTIGGAAAPIPVSNLFGLAVDASQDVWLYTGGPVPPNLVTRIDPTGSVVATATPSVALLQLRTDPFGNAWVLDALAPVLERIDATGVISGPFTVPASGLPVDLDVDPTGRPWVLVRGVPGSGQPPSGTLARLDVNGVPDLLVPLPDRPLAFDVDGCGRPHVLLGDVTSSQEIRVFDPLSGSVVRTIALGSGQYLRMAIDTARHYWLTLQSRPALRVLDPVGTPTTTIFTGATPMDPNVGDPTGLHLVSVLDRSGDSDLDGVVNADELDLGSDPLDPASTPPVLQLLGVPSAGGVFTLWSFIPQEAGFPYVMGASLGSQGFSLMPHDCRRVPLDPDPLLGFWLGPGNVWASNVSGVLDPTGNVFTVVTPPPGGPPPGTRVWFGLLTADPQTGRISSLSLPKEVVFQ